MKPIFTCAKIAQLREVQNLISKNNCDIHTLKRKLNRSTRTIKGLIEDLRKFYGYKIEWVDNRYKIKEDTFTRDVHTDIGTDAPVLRQIQINLSLNHKDFLTVLQSLGENSVIQIEQIGEAIGLEHISLILQAIQEKKNLSFEYQKLTDHTPIPRIVSPYLLKEVRNEWHLVALELMKDYEAWEGGWLKFYNLSKMTNVAFTSDFLAYQDTENIYHTDRFKHCYGAFINEEEGSVERVVLGFAPQYAKQFRNKPFHVTQEILTPEFYEFRMAVYLHVGHYGTEVREYNQELLQDLASYGRQVKVIEPPHLAEALKNYLQEAVSQYT